MADWIVRDSQNLLIAEGHKFESYTLEFLLIPGLFLLFLSLLDRAVFWSCFRRFAQLHLCVTNVFFISEPYQLPGSFPLGLEVTRLALYP